MQALWLAIALWPRLSLELRAKLPQVQQKEGQSLAAALFSTASLGRLLPAFLATSQAQPHLHSLWGAVLGLLSEDADKQVRAVCSAGSVPAMAR